MTLRASRSNKLLLTMGLAFFMLGVVPMQASGTPLGGNGYEIEGEGHSLAATIDNNIDLDNLKPGDKKNMSITLKNIGSKPLTVYMRTNIESETFLYSSRLSDAAQLTVKDGEQVITDKSFSAAAADGDINIGKIAVGAEKKLDVTVDLPEEKMGNEHESASIKLNWIFSAMASIINGGGGSHHHDNDNDSDDNNEPTDPDASLPPEIPDVNEPSQPETPSEIPTLPTPGEGAESGNEKTPATPGMPRTGEASPIYFYGAGALITAVGFATRKK